MAGAPSACLPAGRGNVLDLGSMVLGTPQPFQPLQRSGGRGAPSIPRKVYQYALDLPWQRCLDPETSVSEFLATLPSTCLNHQTTAGAQPAPPAAGAPAPAAAPAAAPTDPEQAAKEETDSRSVYIGNVDYATTPEELQLHFQGCGTVNRVTIPTDAVGNPKVGHCENMLRPLEGCRGIHSPTAQRKKEGQCRSTDLP